MSPAVNHRTLAIALNAAPGLRLSALCRLASEPEAWTGAGGRADRDRTARELGVPRLQLDRALAFLPRLAATAEKERRQAREARATLLTRFDDDYPKPLLDLPLPPPVLYVRGRIPDAPAVAIVGSRKVTPYGRETANLFARSLAALGITIVSGLAVGVDGAAHRGALAAGGQTVAVLGCGLEVDYPRPHRRLREEIADQGAVITEFRCDTLPQAWRFPVRNRLIAALSHGTLVVQAKARSGSLITARLAMELGRDVFAIPGRIFDESALGPNTLIRDGALLAQHPKDILDALPFQCRERLRGFAAGPSRAAMAEAGDDSDPAAGDRTADPPPGPRQGFQTRLLAALPAGIARGPEDLAAALGASLDMLLAALLELELAGWVRRKPGPCYERNA